jgi:phosphatidylserine/phosphatidylglycerophosphate/cardiolipin synthase-like enzyme
LRADQPVGGSGNAAKGSRSSGSAGSSGAAPYGSRASLHSKAAMIDGRLCIIGSMNLDLRSRSKNSEVALAIRSAAFTRSAAAQVDRMIAQDAWRLELRSGHRIAWRAPPGASFGDGVNEPGATFKQRALAAAVAPFAPDEML